jgi:amino acid transporter
VSYLTGAAAVANLVLENLGTLWPVANSVTARAVLIVAIFAVLAAVNIRGAREGARLSAFFALGKLVPLFAIALLGLLWHRLAPRSARPAARCYRSSRPHSSSDCCSRCPLDSCCCRSCPPRSQALPSRYRRSSSG